MRPFLLTVAAAAVLAAQMGNTPTTSNGGQNNVELNPALSVTGKVVMRDGSPVPQNVTIQRVCSGLARTVAYTDAKGRFSFRWSDNSTVVADAAEAGSGASGNTSPSGFGSSQSAGGGNPMASDPFGNRMMNCDVRASVAGFSSTSVSLYNRGSTEGHDIGIIILRHLAGVEGSSVSVTSMMAPKDAKKAYEHGLQALLKNRSDEAAKDFEKAVALYPNYAEAWLNLGKLRGQKKLVEPARTAFQKAIDADPKLIPSYLELGLLYAAEANWKRSGEVLDEAVRLDPVDFPQAWYADAVAHYNLKNYDAAEKSSREAVKLDPKHANPRAEYLLGLVLAEKHDYAGAAAELTAYIAQAPDAPDLIKVKEQLAQLEKRQ